MNNRTDFSYMRSKKAEALRTWYSSGFGEKTSLSCKTVVNACVLPLRKTGDDGLQFGRGGVVKGDMYVEESGIEGRVGGYYEFPVEIDSREETVVYCGALIHQWGHFLVESIPRLWYFLNHDNEVDRYVFISNSSNFLNKEKIGGNYRLFLERLGIWEKVEIIADHPVRYRKILIPELSYSRKYFYNEDYKKIFDVVAKNIVVDSSDNIIPTKVFFSRSHWEKAAEMEPGIDLLDNYFLKNGFKILYPEELTLDEMIFFLRGADICAAESGTLPHNFLFCQDEKEIIIIERQTTVNEIQANLDQIKKFHVTYIDAHYMIYPTSAGYGPYYICYNHLFQRFTEERGFLPPDSKFITEKERKKNLRRYMKAYRKVYGYGWGFENWQLMYDIAYYEAYEDTLKDISDYITRIKPLFIWDLFDLSIVKHTIKRFFRRKPIF